MEQFGTYFQGIYSHLPTNLKKQFPLVSSNISLDRKDRDVIVWAGFDTLEHNRVKRQCLVISYTSGFQIWDIEDLENIQEILSIRNETAKMVKILPPPIEGEDAFKEHRPLVAFGYGFTVQFCTTKNERVNLLKFKSELLGFKATSRLLAVAQRDKIRGFSAHNMKLLFCVDTFPIPKNINRDVMALGPRWLAFPTVDPSNDACNSSSTDDIISTANQWASQLIKFGSETLSDYKKRQPQLRPNLHVAQGTIKVYDIVTKSTIAHWFVHSQPLSFLSFDPSGALLVTSSSEGHFFNVFKITPKSNHQDRPTFQHLYKLQRGYTNTTIGDIAFSNDSLWVSVSSIHGTTHIYPIHPEGGPVSATTHLGEKDNVSKMLIRRDISCQVFGSSERIRQVVVENEDKQPIEKKHDAISSISSFSKTAIAKDFSRKLLILNQLGILTEYTIMPRFQEMLTIESRPVREWDLCRKKDWIAINRGIDNDLFKPRNEKVNPITNVEIITNEPVKIPLWGSPQFSFHAFQKTELGDQSMIPSYKNMPSERVRTTRNRQSWPLIDKSEIPFPDLSPTESNENLSDDLLQAMSSPLFTIE